MSTATLAGGGGAGGVLRQGHLRKLKTMKKKFFVLRSDGTENSARLEYYESEKKFRAGASPRRVLPLKSCYNIMRRLDLKQKHVIALFTREEQFCVVAENEQELHAWLADILKEHCTEDASEELLHPIQHVWQVNVQKKGLGATKNIYGLYNLCLTDKTLTLVKIKSHNNVISELGIPERIIYSLKNIRRCGDSECFFYMEVGRQTTTGAGELWMHTDDSNIAQSMHSTIYHAMRNCAKESENERDHIVIPKEGSMPTRRQTMSDNRTRPGLNNEKGLCMGSCIRQCVCSSATYSIDDSAAALAPITPNAEYQQNNTLTDKKERVIKHHRTESLPGGCSMFQEPLKIVHTRTHSEPLTGSELDGIVDKAKCLNGLDTKKSQCVRRASTGMRFSKLSPAHSKNASTLRNRCDSMPSRTCSSFEVERPTPRHNDMEGMEVSRDEPDAVAEWYRTPRIPEEPDVCDPIRDFVNMSGMSVHHSRTSSLGIESGGEDGYLSMAPPGAGAGAGAGAGGGGYLMMSALDGAGRLSASSGSVCSGTPSTDPRFSEYTLEPATSHFGDSRPPRAYSVGSRPAPAPRGEARHRAYSVGARARPHPHHPHHPRASAEDLMLLDFSNNSPSNKASISRTPPSGIDVPLERVRPSTDEYVDMSPRNGGYVEMRPGDNCAGVPAAASLGLSTTPVGTASAGLSNPGSASASFGTLSASFGTASASLGTVSAAPAPADGYVEMSCGRAATRPIAIGTARAPPPSAASPRARTPLGSGTLFPLSLESPASPAHDAPALSTVREEERASSGGAGAASCSPHYVTLARPPPPDAATNESNDDKGAGAVPVVVGGGGAGASFSLGPLNYAALDLEPRRGNAAPTPLAYTQIDFVRSEKLHADAT